MKYSGFIPGYKKWFMVGMMVVSAMIFTSAPQANSHGQEEFCNWGFVGPTVFPCRGKTYVYGSVACNSGFYQGIFCEQQYSINGALCEGDNSSDTRACYEDFKQVKFLLSQGSCNWGLKGAAFFSCRGKTYVYGSANCNYGYYENIFCEGKYAGNGALCAGDISQNTLVCYEEFRLLFSR